MTAARARPNGSVAAQSIFVAGVTIAPACGSVATTSPSALHQMAEPWTELAVTRRLEVWGSAMESCNASFAVCDVACRGRGAGLVRSGLGAPAFPLSSSPSLRRAAPYAAGAGGKLCAGHLRLRAG